MTELRLASRARLIVIALVLVGGLAVGLWAAWIAWSVLVTNVDATDLKGTPTLIATATAPTLTLTPPRTETLQPTLTLTPTPTLATTTATPTRTTTRMPTRTATRPPPPTRTLTPMLMPIATRTPIATLTPIATPTPARAAMVFPSATPTPIPAPVATTQWLPSFPSEWPGGAAYQPVVASVAPGQKYWRLSKALYCDINDQRNDCPNLPGGPLGTSIYIMLIDANGSRTSAPLLVTKEDGSLATASDIGPEKSPDDPCNCNYTYGANQWAIQVGGAPSDKISGLGLYSVAYKLSNYHVRYFLTFQLITR
jgi:hypothetical protein